MKKLFLSIILNIVVIEVFFAQENLIPNVDFEEYDILLPIDYTNPAMPCEWGEKKIHFDSLQQQPVKENLIEAGSCPIILLNKAGAVYSLYFGAKFFLPKLSSNRNTYLRTGYLATCTRPEIFYDAEKINLRRQQYFNVGLEKYFKNVSKRFKFYYGGDLIYNKLIDTQGKISNQSYYNKLESHSIGLGFLAGTRFMISHRFSINFEYSLSAFYIREKSTSVFYGQPALIHYQNGFAIWSYRPGLLSISYKF